MHIRVTIVYYILCEKSYKERKETKTNKYRRYKIKDIYLNYLLVIHPSESSS